MVFSERHDTPGRIPTLADLSEETERNQHDMSDPQHLDAGDLLSVVVTSLMTGLGGAMAWFTGTKKKIESRMFTYEQTQSSHTTDLAVIRSTQNHLSDRMDEVRELGLSAHRKLDEVLSAVRRP